MKTIQQAPRILGALETGTGCELAGQESWAPDARTSGTVGGLARFSGSGLSIPVKVVLLVGVIVLACIFPGLAEEPKDSLAGWREGLRRDDRAAWEREWKAQAGAMWPESVVLGVQRTAAADAP